MLYRWHMLARYGSYVHHDSGLTTDPARAELYARRRYNRADAITVICRPLERHPIQETLLRLLAARAADTTRGEER